MLARLARKLDHMKAMISKAAILFGLALLVIPDSGHANLCSKRADDRFFIKVIPQSNDRVSFEICEINSNNCTALGRMPSYERADLDRYLFLLDAKTGRKDMAHRLIESYKFGTLGAAIGAVNGFKGAGIPGMALSAGFGRVIGTGIGFYLSGSCDRECQLLETVNRSLSQREWECAYLEGAFADIVPMKQLASELIEVLTDLEAAHCSAHAKLADDEQGSSKTVPSKPVTVQVKPVQPEQSTPAK